MEYFDTHCHLNHSSFQSDLDEVLKRAVDSGVSKILVPGWDLESSLRAVELAVKYPPVVASVGVHPTEIMYGHPLRISEIGELAVDINVVAIGEIGLDYHHDPDHIDEQKSLFNEMLEIAKFTEKKVIIHSRESMGDIKEIIQCWASQLTVENHPLADCPGIFHAFEGDTRDAQDLLTSKFMFGVGGPLTYKNSSQKKAVFSTIPAEAICFETDAPYLSPANHRGSRNEPSFIPEIAEMLASLRNENKDELLNQIFENGYKMFIKDTRH